MVGFMMPSVVEHLVIFDYSGTLSLEAPRFARAENLLRALAECGLAALGVSTPEIFWEKIVAPTWIEGSTTATGYKRVMAERILALETAPGKTGSGVETSASRFVDRYLDQSRIDPRWRPILTELAGNPGAAVVIATDHYAEATEAIARHLGSWDIRARRAGKGGTAPGFSPINRELSPLFIANSADIGFWKADRRFWDVLRRNLRMGEVRSLLIVDDFGFNEERGDLYGEREKVENRREKTRKALGEAFETTARLIPFFLEGAERNPDGDGGRRIEEASRSIRSFLAG
jgi:phosphoglycolate phosphatase-like HAD superfamily hydrolase